MVNHRTTDSLSSISDAAYLLNIRGDCGHLVSKDKKPCYYRNLTFGNKVGYGQLCDDCEQVYKIADDGEDITRFINQSASLEWVKPSPDTNSLKIHTN